MDMGLGGLVLSRMVGQSIEVGHDVKITVVRVGRDSVRLHIAAPQHMNIVRSEIKGRDVPIQESESGISDLGRRRDSL